MKLIVGLGNIGKEYEWTRHNAGFVFVDQLSRTKELNSVDNDQTFDFNKKLKSEILKTSKDSEEILLVKPQTYMNSSGEAIQKVLDYCGCKIENLIVVVDDKDLPLGQVRIRDNGGSAGHKGLQNIIDTIKSDKFTRVRIGIGPYSGNINKVDQSKNLIETSDYVLAKFSDREIPRLKKVVAETIDYLLPFLEKKDDRVISHTLNIL
jgi:PTH1 family peptidyl-tRNA hydrolase